MTHTLSLIVALILIAVQPASADARLLQFLEDRHTHAIMHHVGDVGGTPLALGRADCTDQRALRRDQRNHARRLGRTFERSGIHIDVILTSRWCRAYESARLLELRPVRADPILDGPIDGGGIDPDRVLDFLDGMRASETALLVTHEQNISVLTNRDSKPGEVIVFRMRPGEDIEVRGSFVLE